MHLLSSTSAVLSSHCFRNRSDTLHRLYKLLADSDCEPPVKDQKKTFQKQDPKRIYTPQIHTDKYRAKLHRERKRGMCLARLLKESRNWKQWRLCTDRRHNGAITSARREWRKLWQAPAKATDDSTKIWNGIKTLLLFVPMRWGYLWSATTNGPTVHPQDDIWVWSATVESLKRRSTIILHGSTSSLMMEAVRTSETSVDNHFTRQYIPEDNSENLRKFLRIVGIYQDVRTA
jgi:hypothetical protein